MSTTIVLIPQRAHFAPTTLQTLLSVPILARDDTPGTNIPVPTDDPSFTDIATDIPTATAAPTPSANVLPSSHIASPALVTNSAETCSSDTDCSANQVCRNQFCIDNSNAAPLGGSSSQSTSHLNAAAAVGLGIGVVVLIALIIVGFVFWRVRSRQRPSPSVETPPHLRNRSISSGTGWAGDHDQKTLVGSLPNSPQNALFGNPPNEMSPALFAKALDVIEPGKEKDESRSQSSLDETRSIATMKALPPRPLSDSPPPTPAKLNFAIPHTQPSFAITPAKPDYALNVSINKSMIFDEEMKRAVSPSLNSPSVDSLTSRTRAPRYQFEEVIPSSTVSPRLSINRRTVSSKRSSEYEMQRYSRAETVSEAAEAREDHDNVEEPQSPKNVPLPEDGTDDEQESRYSQDEMFARDSTFDEDGPRSPREQALARLESKAPQIEAPLPSPSFSFRSYDWYQDIIGDSSRVGSPTASVRSRSPGQTPTTATFSPGPTPTTTAFPQSPVSSSPRLSEITASLFPEPPNHGGGPQFTTSYLHPNTALSSPTASSFRLSPTVYQMPSPRSKPSPLILEPMPSPRSKPSPLLLSPSSPRGSRSWLPEEGLYLPDDGGSDTFEVFTRSGSKPSIYSPLN